MLTCHLANGFSINVCSRYFVGLVAGVCDKDQNVPGKEVFRTAGPVLGRKLDVKSASVFVGADSCGSF